MARRIRKAVRVAIERASRLKKPIYILENGVPDAQDRIRPWLLVNVIEELHKLIGEGHDIRGYFHWTLTDNFEWTEGWRLRFGLFELNPATQERTIRSSGRLYREIVRANQLTSQADRHLSIPSGSTSNYPLITLVPQQLSSRIHGILMFL